MSNSKNLTSDVSTHFAFGENWSNYAATIDEPRIASAVENLRSLLRRDSLEGLSFVDVGCGSGIHALAALRLGASRLLALDIDPKSVETSRQVLTQFAPASQWECRVGSAFALAESCHEQFDVVYSWGVLHHTGDMWTAIRNVARLVKPGGSFALALYVKTKLCGFWKIEKRIYSKLPRWLQFPFICLYSVVDLARLTLRGRNPVKWVREYKKKRGMNFWHDAHDWLGGYPYESASEEEVTAFLKTLGFSLVHAIGVKASLGLTGSGCAEYLFVRDSI